MQPYINRVSISIAGAPLLNYALTISELPLFSFTHLSTSPPCPVLSLHRQPAKPDSQAAYQAFCQPACLIVLSKHPPAFCLPPPPQKNLPGLAHSALPPLSFFSYLTGCLAFGFPVPSLVLRSSACGMCNLTVFPFKQEIHGSFSFQATDGLRKCLTSR